MAFIVNQFKAIADWLTPKSKAKEIIAILEQVARGNFSHKIAVPEKSKDEHSQILKGLKLTLAELRKLNRRSQRRHGQLQEANQKLSELDRNKREFMELASHQLKTPLASMELGLDLLARKGESWGEDECLILDEVRGSYARLSKLVRSLLAAVQIEDKISLEPRFKKTQLAPIIDLLVKHFKANLEAKGIKFTINHGATGLSLKTDLEFLIDILQNLLENALQYTDQGEVALAVVAKNGRVEFIVADTGLGIPLQDQPHAFDKLFRGHNVKDRAELGSGLGLYYTKQLVKKLKGKISFESQEGKGTTFCVSLPRN